MLAYLQLGGNTYCTGTLKLSLAASSQEMGGKQPVSMVPITAKQKKEATPLQTLTVLRKNIAQLYSFGNMPKKKLVPGVGAKGSILTRFIRPKQPSPQSDQNSKHRSDIFLLEQFANEKGKMCFRFCFIWDKDKDDRVMLEANCRHVKVEEEGNVEDFFSSKDKEKRKIAELQAKQFKEPKIKWEKSMAKKLLYNDIVEGRVPLDPKDDDNGQLNLKGIYSMRPEYSEYDYDKFSGRLSSVRKTIRDFQKKASQDRKRFDRFKDRNPVSELSHKGYIQWQGSEAQELLRQDIREKKHENMSKMDLWGSQPEYFTEFPLDAFRDKLYQEIRTAKYLHTLEHKGKKKKKKN